MKKVTIGRKNIEFFSTEEEVNNHQKAVEEYEVEALMKKLSGQESNKRHVPLGKIVVVGCGGTGSWLIPKLAKTINDMKRKNLLANDFSLVLVDGDTVNLNTLIGRV